MRPSALCSASCCITSCQPRRTCGPAGARREQHRAATNAQHCRELRGGVAARSRPRGRSAATGRAALTRPASRQVAGRLFTAALGAQSGSGLCKQRTVPGWVTARRCGAAEPQRHRNGTHPAIPGHTAPPGGRRRFRSCGTSPRACRERCGSAARCIELRSAAAEDHPCAPSLLTRLGPLLRSSSRPGPESPRFVPLCRRSRAAPQHCPQRHVQKQLIPGETGPSVHRTKTRYSFLQNRTRQQPTARSPHSKANPALPAQPRARADTGAD